METMHDEAKRFVNGVDVQRLEDTIAAINKDPDLASFSFHAENEWVDGSQNKTIVHRFESGNQPVERARPFVIHSDQPEALMGADSAPNAIVSLLHALASCLSVVIVYNASLRGITLDKVNIALDGDIDVHGFLGLSKEVRPGFQDVRVLVDVHSDAPKAEIEELVRYAQKVSPILDSLRNRIPVEVEVV
jgi:uncharacterized OsmC-like protein